MKNIALAALLAVAFSGCSAPFEAPETSPSEPRIFKTAMGQEVYWDYLPAADWAYDLPVLAIAKVGPIYPTAPDVELTIWCRHPGQIELHNAYNTGDVNPLPKPKTIGLTNGVLTISGTPNWQATEYGSEAEVALSAPPDKLRKLLSGAFLSVTISTESAQGSTETDQGAGYSAPPKALAEAFVNECLNR